MSTENAPASQWAAGKGEIWVCAACGRTGKRRDQMGDTSCFLHAVLCEESSVCKDSTGRVVDCQAVTRASCGS